MIVSGRRVVRWDPALHRRERRTWPPRFVVHRVAIGWNECELCGRWHRIWIVDDRTWRRLPRRLCKLRICVACFRKFAKRREK